MKTPKKNFIHSSLYYYFYPNSLPHILLTSTFTRCSFLSTQCKTCLLKCAASTLISALVDFCPTRFRRGPIPILFHRCQLKRIHWSMLACPGIKRGPSYNTACRIPWYVHVLFAILVAAPWHQFTDVPDNVT